VAYPRAPSPSYYAFSFVVLPYVDASLPDQADDGDGNDDSQAALARFTFDSMRKHFSSGVSFVDRSHHPSFRYWWWCDQGLRYGPGHAPHREHARSSVNPEARLGTDRKLVMDMDCTWTRKAQHFPGPDSDKTFYSYTPLVTPALH
jgi:hypothetical protein